MNKEEFISDLNVKPELIGSPALLSPFLQQISSQRALMMSSNLGQVMVVHGCEIARIQTGFESKFGKYEFNASERDQDIQVLEVVPKFKSGIGDYIKSNPQITVIYMGCDDGKIGTFDVSSYTTLYSGFGYINKKLNGFQLSKNNYVSKDVKLQTSPNHDGDLYSMGVNANVCYLPMWDTTDDAFVISSSLAKKCEHTYIDTLIVNIHPDDIVLNLYGNDEEYKCMPDIGDRVRDDGIILGFRTINKSSFLSDLTQEALRRPEHNHDELHIAPAGAEILDIQVYTNHKKYKESCDGVYSQIMKYQAQHYDYYATIIDAYERYKKEGCKITSQFNSLITKYKGLCLYRGGKGMTLMNKKEPVDFIQLRITWAITRSIAHGFKLSGRDGAKGVISAIWNDEDMPTTPDGVRADLLITGESPFNRLNVGQNSEQFIGHHLHKAATIIRKHEVDWTTEQLYTYALNAIKAVRPVYGKLVEEMCNTIEKKADFVASVKEDGIYMVIPAFCDDIGPQLILKLSQEYDIKPQPLTYKVVDPETGEKQVITTKYGTIIGSKYIYLLGKIPINQLSSIEFGYISQFMSPIKPTSKSTKSQSMFGQTPMRYGEDESAVLTMSVGSELVARLFGVYSNSPVATNLLCEKLLTDPHPTALRNIGMTTKEIVDTSGNVGILKHQLAATGRIISDPYKQ